MSVRPAPRPIVLPDKTVDDVKDVCEQIHALARAKTPAWDLKKLGEKAGIAWQSFNNWKQGHEAPKVNLLQRVATAVGGRIRVTFETIADSQGHAVLLPSGDRGDTLRQTPGDEELVKALGLAAITNPGVRRAATMAAREAAMRAVAEHSKQASGNPPEPTADRRPSRSRRKASGSSPP